MEAGRECVERTGRKHFQFDVRKNSIKAQPRSLLNLGHFVGDDWLSEGSIRSKVGRDPREVAAILEKTAMMTALKVDE